MVTSTRKLNTEVAVHCRALFSGRHYVVGAVPTASAGNECAMVAAPFSFFQDKRAHRARIELTYRLERLARQQDKVEHFLASLLIVVFVHAILWRQKVCRRLITGLVVGAFFGLAKEAADASGLWPWCPPCAADDDDMLADGMGLLASVALLGMWHFCIAVVRRSKGYRSVGLAPVAESVVDV